MPFPYPPFFCFLALSDGICYGIFSCNFSRQWIKSFAHSWNQFHMKFFWVHSLPPGNKFFTILRFLLKAMATNPLPWLQGSWKQWQQILCQSFKVSWKQLLQIFGHSFKVSWKQWPALGTFWKVLERNFLMKPWCCCWQQILQHAFNIPGSKFLWNRGAVPGNKSFAMPSSSSKNFLSNFGAIPGNKFLHHSFKVPNNNFLWNWSCCNS